MRPILPVFASLAVMLSATPSFAQGATPPAQPGLQPQPGQQQQPGQWQQQQPGQWQQQQQPGQWQQQPGQWQQQPGQGQPGQWQQQPGQWQQQPGQWQQQPGTAQTGGWEFGVPQPIEHHPEPFASSLGLKLLLGADLWTTPDSIDPGYDALGFAGSAGGFGWTAGFYYEARIYRYFGIELDIGRDEYSLHRNLTYKIISNGVPAIFDVTERVSAHGLRWGFLFKGIIPVDWGRVWFGLGPDFVSGGSVDGSVEITSGNPTPTQKSNLENSIHVTSKSSTLLTMAFGMAVDLGDHFEIPFDLRAAKNLSQDSAWTDRVSGTKTLLDPAPKYDVTVQSSWDFRVGTGLGYRF